MMPIVDSASASETLYRNYGVSAMRSVRLANLLIILSGCYLSMRLRELARKPDRS
jgi:hypothetical protein